MEGGESLHDRAFLTLAASERLVRDTDAVMNSLFWLDQLKVSNAHGLTDARCGKN
jgi:hypothetical protein